MLLCLLAASQIDGSVQTVEAALASRDYRRALTLLEAAPDKDARWHALASRVHDGLNDPARAVADAEAALKLEPGNPAHHLQLAQIFLSRNTPGAALEILSEADALFPNSFVIRLGKGLALKELLRYQEAERELAWCLSQQPASAIAFDALATMYIQQSRFADARQVAVRFLEKNTTDYRGFYFLAAGRDGELLPAP
ncbi:MAG: tetratricopeptide repeat protein, partial [Bryobacteraceae bacterium]